MRLGYAGFAVEGAMKLRCRCPVVCPETTTAAPGVSSSVTAAGRTGTTIDNGHHSSLALHTLLEQGCRQPEPLRASHLQVLVLVALLAVRPLEGLHDATLW